MAKTPKETPKRGRGRPRAEFDRKLVQTLAGIGCTQDEIAMAVGIHVQTLIRNAREELDAGYADIRRSLRRWQYESAKGGNTAMLIWLGKQYLGQRDKAEQTIREEVVTIEELPLKPPSDA